MNDKHVKIDEGLKILARIIAGQVLKERECPGGSKALALRPKRKSLLIETQPKGEGITV